MSEPPMDFLDFDDEDFENLTKEQVEAIIEHGKALLDKRAYDVTGAAGTSTGHGQPAAGLYPDAEQIKKDLDEAEAKLKDAQLEHGTLHEAAERTRPVCEELKDSMPLAAADIRSAQVEEEEVCAKYGSVAEAEAAAAAKARERGKKERSLDLAFLVDNTGSMVRSALCALMVHAPIAAQRLLQATADERGAVINLVIQAYIDATKTKLGEIMDQVMQKHPNVVVRIAYVGYRDYCDARRFEVMPFTDRDPVSALRTFLEPVKAMGGGDGPEDIVGGLRNVAALDWQAPTKLCIHFCDAPAHGTLYTSLKDTYPGGDPEGETCEQYLKELGRKGVDFHFARITSHTDQMISVWKREVYEGNDGAFFEEHTCKDQATDFVPVVLRSLQRSLSRSSAGSAAEASAPPAMKSKQSQHKMMRAKRHARS